MPTPPRLARLHWSLGVLLGLVYLGVGALLLAAPDVGVPTLLLALGAYWLASGGISALAALTRPRQATHGWQLLLALGQLGVGAYVWLELYVGIPIQSGASSLVAGLGALAYGAGVLLTARREPESIVVDRVVTGAVGLFNVGIGATLATAVLFAWTDVPDILGSIMMVLGVVSVVGAIGARLDQPEDDAPYHEIALHLQRVEDLFAAPAPTWDAGYIERFSGIERVVNTLGPRAPRPHIRLTVVLPLEQVESDLAPRVAAAIRRYCEQRLRWDADQVVAHRKEAVQSLERTLLILAVALALMLLAEQLDFVSEFIRQFLVNGLTVIAWVSMWDPVRLFLFPTYPNRREDLLYRRLLDAEVVVEAQCGATEPQRREARRGADEP